jgi:tetratricopeptide (TPR) repeat protein
LILLESAGMAQEEVTRANTRGATSRPSGSITGRVVLPSGQPLNERIRITLSSLTDPGAISYTDNSGGFGFRNLGEGNYTLEVIPAGKVYETMTQEVRLIRGMQVRLIVTLKEASSSGNKETGKVVSVAETDQHIPAPAKKEFEKATRFVSQGRIEEAIAGFKRAIAIFPEYLMARNDLGVQYLNQNRLAEAAEQLEAAIQINDKAFNPNLNLAIVLIKQKNYSDAMESLHRALAIDSSSPAAHLYSGIVLVEMDELERAERELTTALSIGGNAFARAHFFLGRLFLKTGEREKAIRELRSYLTAEPGGEYAAAAMKLIEEVKK